MSRASKSTGKTRKSSRKVHQVIVATMAMGDLARPPVLAQLRQIETALCKETVSRLHLYDLATGQNEFEKNAVEQGPVIS
jgi:hypothetical protein